MNETWTPRISFPFSHGIVGCVYIEELTMHDCIKFHMQKHKISPAHTAIKTINHFYRWRNEKCKEKKKKKVIFGERVEPTKYQKCVSNVWMTLWSIIFTICLHCSPLMIISLVSNSDNVFQCLKQNNNKKTKQKKTEIYALAPHESNKTATKKIQQI